MTKFDILDEIAEIRRMLFCFSQLFLLLSSQSEPLDSEVLGTISRFLEDAVNKEKTIEKEIASVEFEKDKML